MRDIMDSRHSANLSVKQRLLETADAGLHAQAGEVTNAPRSVVEQQQKDAAANYQDRSIELEPRTLLNLKDDHLVFKAEKVVSGRRVLVAFYNETTKEDILDFTHNIRVVVA